MVIRIFQIWICLFLIGTSYFAYWGFENSLLEITSSVDTKFVIFKLDTIKKKKTILFFLRRSQFFNT